MSRSSKLPEAHSRLCAGTLSARPVFRPVALALAISACCVMLPAGAAGVRNAAATVISPGDLVVRAQPGETLIEIGNRELAPPNDWRSLARLNGIRRPTLMPVGQTILIPAAWRKPYPVKATVVSVQGAVKNAGTEIKAGASLAENDRIETGANAVAVVKLPDGTYVRIPPASQVRIDRLRGYHGSEAINARINLDQGDIEVQSQSSRLGTPPIIGREVQVQTPKATASVRGTSFRIGTRADSAQAEVLDGSVSWAGASEGRTLPGGVGVIVDASGKLGKSEFLLPKPEALVSPGKLEEVDAELEFKAVPGARRYLVEVARDKGFADLISQTTQVSNKAVVHSDQDGPLYLKVRPIGASGLAGFDAQFALDVEARPVYPKVSISEPIGVIFGKESSLRWNPVKEADRYRIQIAADAGFSRVVSDELTRAPQFKFALNAPVSDITPFYWRVASVDKVKQGPWAGAKKLEFAPVMGPVSPQLADDSVKFEWTGRPDQTFETQLSLDPAFASIANSATVKGVSWKLSSLPPGQYQMRVRQLFSNGLKGPYSPVLQFDMPTLLRDGSGQPIHGGTGDAIRTTH